MYKQAIVNNLVKLAISYKATGALAGALSGGFSSLLHNAYDPREVEPGEITMSIQTQL